MKITTNREALQFNIIFERLDLVKDHDLFRYLRQQSFRSKLAQDFYINSFMTWDKGDEYEITFNFRNYDGFDKFNSMIKNKQQEELNDSGIR